MTKPKSQQQKKTEAALSKLVEDIITPADVAARKKYVERIQTAMGKTVMGVLESGKVLLEAKEGPRKLKHGQFIPMVEEDLKMNLRNAERIMEVAKNPHLSNPTNLSYLPPTWTTLYELTKVPPHRLEVLLEKGKITPHITGKEVKELLPKNKSTKKQKYANDDEPEEETTPVSNPGFYTGLGGSDTMVKGKGKKLSEEANLFIRGLHKAVYVEFATKFVEWYDKHGSELDQTSRHALDKEIEACALELQRIAQVVR